MRPSAVRQALHQRDQALAEGTAGATRPAHPGACHRQPADRLVEMIGSVVELLDELYGQTQNDLMRPAPNTPSLRAAGAQLLQLANTLDEASRVDAPQPSTIDPSVYSARGEWVEAGR